MFADRKSMIGREQNDRVLQLPHFIELVEQLSNSIINLCAHRQVDGTLTAYCFRAVRWFVHHLVPNQHVTIVEGMD